MTEQSPDSDSAQSLSGATESLSGATESPSGAQPPSGSAQPASGRGQSPRWLLLLVVAGAAVAMLLLGAAAGLLIGMRQSEPAAAPAPDSVDVGFCQDMTVHHRQAATMAALARQRAEDPIVRTIAFNIETTQIEQVGRMQGWLSLWGRDRSSSSGKYMAWMSSAVGHGAQHGADGSTAVDRMPGMATPEELDRLAKASGAEFDVLFLQLMVRHHQGGTAMLQYAADHAEVDVVSNLAKQTLIAQGKETDQMTQLLADRGAHPLPN
jgi:uncharacterized protein (DUF305 family)